MKALALRQPWAWAILHAGKRVENRVWNTHYRGVFLIHASAGCTRGEYTEAAHWMASLGLARVAGYELGAMADIALQVAGVDVTKLPLVPSLAELPRGGIVGQARLDHVIAPSVDGKPRRPWHMAEQYGFVLEDVLELKLRPLSGNRRWFNVPDAFGSGTIRGEAQ